MPIRGKTTRPARPIVTMAEHPAVEAGRVEVRVLGPVDVMGASWPFVRKWSLELVVYLALHPAGVRNEIWPTALWPDQAMAPATLWSVAWAARRSLGQDPSGVHHLPRRRGSLQLAPTVSTDWHRLRRAASSPSPSHWAEGLGLVRGRPFDGLAGDDWVVMEGLAVEVPEGVSRLALRLGEHHLARGDARRATAALRRGLLANPFDERLYRLLMRAADLEGNPAGVEAAMAELLRQMGAPAGAEARIEAAPVHPQTARLYRSLSRRIRPEHLPAASGGAAVTL
jgi:DNA-binding SARP family transcriptional activator